MPRRRQTSNPAQRLYTVLEQHTQSLHENAVHGYDAVWAQALNVDVSRVTEEVAQAFGLIGEVERALAATQDPYQKKNFELHKENWSRAFIPSASGRQSQVSGGDTSEESRAALGGIASHLRDNFAEGRLPTEEERVDLRSNVQQLINDLIEDDSLPIAAADLFSRRLHDMLWALDHLAIMGPDGVAAVCERLVIALVLAEQGTTGSTDSRSDERKTLLKRIGELVSKASGIVSVPGAWYGSYQAYLAIEPYVDAVRHIGGA